MKHLQQYIVEKQLNETCILDGIGKFVLWFKRLFMPWTVEACRWYGKKFRKLTGESVTAITSLPKPWHESVVGGMQLTIYDCSHEDDAWYAWGNELISQKEHPAILPLPSISGEKTLKYVICIGNNTDENNSMWGVVVPGEDKIQTILFGFSKNTDEKFRKKLLKILPIKNVVKLVEKILLKIA